jgi:cold shock CspA family protein
MQGFIKKVTNDRAFGFIRAEDGIDYFFHQSALHERQADRLMEVGRAVTFEPQIADRGPRATDVRVAA